MLHTLLTPVQASAVKFSSLETKSANYTSAGSSSSASATPSLNLMTLGLVEEGTDSESERKEEASTGIQVVDTPEHEEAVECEDDEDEVILHVWISWSENALLHLFLRSISMC